MDEPILQGATVLLSCLLTRRTAALGHARNGYLLREHVDSSFETFPDE